MTRKKKDRTINDIPDFVGYIPVGIAHENQESVTFLYEEFEAIKLVDYNGLNFEDAAKSMNVSKSTFGRIILNARKKIAKAFVEIRPIRASIEDLASIDNFRYCTACFSSFTELPHNTVLCPKCNSKKTVILLKEK